MSFPGCGAGLGPLMGGLVKYLTTVAHWSGPLEGHIKKCHFRSVGLVWAPLMGGHVKYLTMWPIWSP